MPVCNLCLTEKPFVRSHVFPRWWLRHMMKDAREREGRQPYLLRVSSREPGRAVRIQDGFFCKDILCGECDTSLGPFDRAAKQCLVDQDWWGMQALVDDQGFSFIQITQDWIEPLTRFIVSVLCRAHWTAQPPFDSFSIGPHAARLGDFRFVAIEDLLSRYPWVMIRWGRGETIGGETIEPDFLTQIPIHTRSSDGRRCVIWHFSGFSFMMKIDSQDWLPQTFGNSVVRLGSPIHVHCFPFTRHPEFHWLQRSIRG